MQPVAIRARVAPLVKTIDFKAIKWQYDDEVFMGVDGSLTATGVAILFQGSLKTFRLSPKLRGAERLDWFRTEFSRIFREYRPTKLAIEGYSFGSKFSHAHSLGELGGVLRLAAYDCRLPTIIAPPTNVKQFATGKGNVVKGIVIKEAFKRYGIDVTDDNEADAAILALMAASHARDVTLTSFQHAAMMKVETLR